MKTANTLSIEALRAGVEGLKQQQVWEYYSPWFTAPAPTQTISFGHCTTIFSDDIVDNKKEEDMSTSQQTLEMKTMDYLLRRLDNVECDKSCKLDEQYGFVYADNPKTSEELQKYLDEGWLKFEKFDTRDLFFQGWKSLIYFQDPKITQDEDGRTEARERIHKRYTEVKDIIMVMTAEDGLKALQEFEQEDFGPKGKKSK